MGNEEKSDSSYVWDMVDCAESVMNLTSNKSFTDYQAQRGLRRAVERELEIIGEAARHVSVAFQAAHAEIPWRPIIAQRHVLSHEYGEIDDQRIWRVVTIHVPELLKMLRPLLPMNPPHPMPPDAAAGDQA